MDLKFRAKRDFQICSGKKNPELFWKYASEIQDKKGLPESFGKKNPKLFWKNASEIQDKKGLPEIFWKEESRTYLETFI